MSQINRVWQKYVKPTLQRTGIYYPLYRTYYVFRDNYYRFVHPTTTITIGQMTKTFATETVVHYRWVHELLGEEDILLRWLSMIEEGDVVWDIGAHAGIYAILSAEQVGMSGHVYAFEPEPITAQTLQKNFQLNQVDNGTFMPLAIGDENGEATLYTDWRGLGINKLFYESRLQGKPVNVTVRRGDDLLEDGVKQPTLVKLDIEGWEGKALPAMKKALSHPICRVLFIEVHTTNLQDLGQDVSQIKEIIYDMGLTIAYQDQRATKQESGRLAEQMHWICTKQSATKV